jgi:hypothetical protein
VLVLWSAAAVASEWVTGGGGRGAQAARADPVRIEAGEPPLGFRAIQAADLRGWDGTATAPSSAGWGDIAALLGPPPAEPTRRRPRPRASRGRSSPRSRRASGGRSTGARSGELGAAEAARPAARAAGPLRRWAAARSPWRSPRWRFTLRVTGGRRSRQRPLHLSRPLCRRPARRSRQGPRRSPGCIGGRARRAPADPAWRAHRPLGPRLRRKRIPLACRTTGSPTSPRCGCRVNAAAAGPNPRLRRAPCRHPPPPLVLGEA